MIEKITIKFGTELKPIKTNWKSQLYKPIEESMELEHHADQVLVTKQEKVELVKGHGIQSCPIEVDLNETLIRGFCEFYA